MKRSLLGWSICIFSLFALALHYASFSILYRHLFDTTGFATLFRIMFGLFSFCAIVMFYTRSKVFFYVAWGVFVLLFFIFNYFFFVLQIMSFSLALLVILHIALYERYPLNLIIASGYSILSTIAHSSCSLRKADGRLTLLLLGDVDFLVFSAVVTIVSTLMIHYREKTISTQMELNTMKAAVYELTKANLKYQDYAQETLERSTERERQRLTRDIHDIAGYALTNAMMMTESGKIMLKNDPDKLPEHFDSIRETLSTCMDQIRSTLHNLRSVPITTVRGFAAISRLVKIFSAATKIDVRLEYGNVNWHFDEEEGAVIYHFIQEGLINSFRHGKPSALRVLFYEDDAWTEINILDNGRGANSVQEGIGITGMKERAESVGGRVEIATVVDGFSISIYIPSRGVQNVGRTD